MTRDPKTLIRLARETGEEASAEPLDLGARVRELRKAYMERHLRLQHRLESG